MKKKLKLAYMQRNKNRMSEEQMWQESPPSLEQYKLSLPRFRFLACIVSQKLFTINLILACTVLHFPQQSAVKSDNTHIKCTCLVPRFGSK